MSAYICPMHAKVRLAAPGKCPHCGMGLVPEGVRFPIIRHMLSSPLHIAVMIVAMLVLMAIAMMVR